MAKLYYRTTWRIGSPSRAEEFACKASNFDWVEIRADSTLDAEVILANDNPLGITTVFLQQDGFETEEEIQDVLAKLNNCLLRNIELVPDPQLVRKRIRKINRPWGRRLRNI